MKRAICLLMCAAAVSMCVFAVGCGDDTTEDTSTSYEYTIPTAEPTTVAANVKGLDKLEKQLVYAVAEEVDQWAGSDIKTFTIKEISGYSEHLGTVYIKYNIKNNKKKIETSYMYLLIDSEAKGAEVYTPYMDVDAKQFKKIKEGYINQKKFNVKKINKALKERWSKMDFSD